MSSDDSTNSWNTKRFDGSDYSKFRLRFTLYIKKKEWNSALDTRRPAATSTDSKDRDAWDKNDIKVQSTLVNAVSDRILDEIQHETTAKGMIDVLDSVYLRKSLMMRILAKKRLLNLKINDGEDAQNFFSRFEKHISALRDAGEEVSAEERLSYLLLILPEKYSHIIDVLDAMPEAQRTVDYVKGKMMFDHCREEKSQEVVEDSTALRTQVVNRFERADRGPGRGGASGNNHRCHRCGMVGHYRRDCRVNLQYSGQGTNGNPGSGNRGNRGNIAAQNTEINVGDNEVSAYQVKLSKAKTGFMGNIPCAESEGGRLRDVINVSGSGNGDGERHRMIVWTLDSGCTDHIVNTDKYFCKKFKLDVHVNVKVADGHILTATHSGNISMFTVVNGVRKPILLRNVYFAPELDNNLLSFDRITKANFSILAQGEVAKIINPVGNVIGIAKKVNKLYELNSFVSESIVCSVVDVSGGVTGTTVAEKWHRLLGHVNFNDLKELCSKQLLIGVPQMIGRMPEVCDICLESKFCNLGHTGVRTRATRIMELIHSDVNFVSPVGYNGDIAFVSFIDDFSRLATVYCIKSKSQVTDKFMHYINVMSNLTDSSIKAIRCDRGTEFLNARFYELCSSRGIETKPSPAYVHELNGTAERFNRTIMNRARCLRAEANIDRKYWPECVKTAAYLGNRTLANTMENKTPFEIFFGKKPDVTNLKFFGSVVYIRVPDVRRKCKMDAKAEKGVLVGFMETGYRILVNGTIKETPYVRLASEQLQPVKQRIPSMLKYEESTTEEDEENGKANTVENFENLQVEENLDEENTGQSNRNQEGEAEAQPEGQNEAVENQNVGQQGPEQIQQASSRPIRTKRKPSHLDDYVVQIKLCTTVCTPDSYQEAMRSEDAVAWKMSMDEEIRNLQKNMVWKLVDMPNNRKVIPVKWVYRIKPNGKFKSRLVAVGFRQPLNDQEETYSPVAAMATLRVVLSMSCHLGFHIHQMDVECAFLNGDVKGEVFVSQPRGYELEDGKVYQLQKALYGLRESPRAWYECFHKFMVELGFLCSDYDSCLYIKWFNRDLLGLILYVDDLLISSGKENLVMELKRQLEKKFSMTDLGEIKNYLGIEVEYSRGARVMTLNQSKYINSLAEKYNVEQMRKSRTPMEKNLNLQMSAEGDSYVSEYRSLIGALLFIGTGTRLDVSYAINYLSRFQRCATATHFRYALRVLRYLQETSHMKLTFAGNVGQALEGWADADWAADSVDRKSTGGILIRAFGNPVLWNCKKQSTVARASTYAEYIALADAVSELMPVIGVMKNLRVSFDSPIPIYEDNSGAVVLASKGKFTKRAKHIEVAYNFVADYVAKGLIVVKKVDSKDQLADILTKALSWERFSELRKAVSIY